MEAITAVDADAAQLPAAPLPPDPGAPFCPVSPGLVSFCTRQALARDPVKARSSARSSSGRRDSPTGATPSSDSPNGSFRWRPARDRCRSRCGCAARRRRGRRHQCGLGDRPFLLCLGRVDDGKGAQVLAACFDAVQGTASRTARPRLRGAGGERAPRPSRRLRDRSGRRGREVGIAPRRQVLVSASAYESFSIVLLEGWSVGTPALVNGWCEVTREHALRSGAGLRSVRIPSSRSGWNGCSRPRRPAPRSARGSRLRRGALPLA